MRHRSILLVALVALIVLASSSCGEQTTGPDAGHAAAETTTTVAVATTTAALTPIGEAAERVAPVAEPTVAVTTPELRQEAIVAAAVLIASGGDLEAAILDGIVGEAEAEAALRAIEEGTLGDLLTRG